MDSCKIVKAQKQFLIDTNGFQILDCSSNNAHVGHCHPRVVASAQYQMRKLETSQGFLASNVYTCYIKALLNCFPKELSSCFLVNSRSEANDLALYLAKAFTKHKGFVTFENSYFGSFSSLLNITTKSSGPSQDDCEKITHLPLPKSSMDDSDDQGAADAKLSARTKIQRANEEEGRIAAFMSEMVLYNSGTFFISSKYLKVIYEIIHSVGGVCIADESHSGLGRLGKHFWGFQYYGVMPDIVTVGEVLGNGFPMAAVITTNEISRSIGHYISTYGGNPVACSIGLSVLEIIENEKLMNSGAAVGHTILEGLHGVKGQFACIGGIFGMSLCIGITIVEDKSIVLTPSDVARSIHSSLFSDHRILVQVVGPHNDVIALTPPMCFTQQNARTLISALGLTLASIYSKNRSMTKPEVSFSSKRFKEDAQSADQVPGTSFKKSKTDYEDID